MADLHESKFEAELCEHLGAHGRLCSRDDTGYDRARALFRDDVIDWLRETQPDELAKVASEDQLLDRVVKVLDGPLESTGGTLNLPMRGFQTGAASFDMVQRRPETADNPKTTKRCAANPVRVMRQVHYVATVEPKTDFTQSNGLAVEQYRKDRTPRDSTTNKVEPLLQFGRRALVHFAVSNTDAQMTTHLRGPETAFLPFNAGNEGGADYFHSLISLLYLEAARAQDAG